MATTKFPSTGTDPRSLQRRRELGRVRLCLWLTGEAASNLEQLTVAWNCTKTAAIEKAIAMVLQQEVGE